jgi:TatA/E family protein of Tat protein translocase
MFGPLGFPELIFILVLALLIFGPKRLPEIGRTIGRGMAEFRKASTDLKRTINTELALDEPVAPPVRPWMETAAAPVVPAITPANTPANTTARAPETTWFPPSEPSLEPEDMPDLPLSADEAPSAEVVSPEVLSPEPLEPS